MPTKLAFPGTAHAPLYYAMQSWASEQARLERAAERQPAYALAVSHAYGKVGEVAAGTCGVGLVGLHQAAALGRPVAQHGALRVVPEGAVSIEVVLGLLCGGGRGVRSGESPPALTPSYKYSNKHGEVPGAPGI